MGHYLHALVFKDYELCSKTSLANKKYIGQTHAAQKQSRRKLLSPRSISNRHHFGVFIAQIITRLQNVAVIGLGQHYAIFQHSGSRTNLDGVAFQYFDFVDNGFF